MDKLKIAKKHFQKFGLSENVLATIVALLPEDETATEETIAEQLQAYESLAKSFQSEVERRVSKARENQEPKPNPNPNPKKETEADAVLKALTGITQRLEAMEKGQISAGLNKSAIEKLKALKMTDKEIESVLLGRNFETEDAVNEFVTKQGEIYEEILMTRHKENAGSGFNPMSGQNGSYTKKAIEQDIAEFNKQF